MNLTDCSDYFFAKKSRKIFSGSSQRSRNFSKKAAATIPPIMMPMPISQAAIVDKTVGSGVMPLYKDIN